MLNPPNAQVCDCGWDFVSASGRTSVGGAGGLRCPGCKAVVDKPVFRTRTERYTEWIRTDHYSGGFLDSKHVGYSSTPVERTREIVERFCPNCGSDLDRQPVGCFGVVLVLLLCLGLGWCASAAVDRGPARARNNSLRGSSGKRVVYPDWCAVRAGPSTATDRLAGAKPGVPYEVLEVEGGWRKIRMPSGTVGWAGCSPR